MKLETMKRWAGLVAGNTMSSMPNPVSPSGITKGDWILLTGNIYPPATGFIAPHTLVALLNAGYRVKVTASSQDKADEILKAHPEDAANLDFVIIPELLSDTNGAFDEAVQGVTGIVHTAAPYVSTAEDIKTEVLEPAIRGTKGILESVTKYGAAVKRVVITSAFGAIFDPLKGNRPGYVYTEADWNPVTYEQALTSNLSVAVGASQALAEKAAWDYVATASFSLATVCPPTAYGPLSPNGANLSTINLSSANIYALINGSTKTVPATSSFAWVDIRDVALAHVRALEKAPGTEDRFFTTAGVYSIKEICSIIKRVFPELVSSGKTPDPDAPDAPEVPEHYGVDGTLATKELGLVYTPLEDTVVTLVRQLLELEKKVRKQKSKH